MWVVIFVRCFLKILLLAFTVTISTASFAKVDVADLKSRAEARWDTIVNYKFGETYKFETPTYRSVFPENLFRNQFSHAVEWSLTKIQDVKYDPVTNVATVKVLVETKPRGSSGSDAQAKTASVEIREKWLHIKGQWWHSSSD